MNHDVNSITSFFCIPDRSQGYTTSTVYQGDEYKFKSIFEGLVYYSCVLELGILGIQVAVYVSGNVAGELM